MIGCHTLMRVVRLGKGTLTLPYLIQLGTYVLYLALIITPPARAGISTRCWGLVTPINGLGNHRRV